MEISVKTSKGTYKVITGRGILRDAAKYMNLCRRVLIVTDSGVPAEYARAVAGQAKAPVIYTVREGEGSKSLESYKILIEELIKHGFTRTDCIVAVGGGVVGDLAGFVAATYMRGIDFYNVPTTVLSQVDSSVGGKTAIDVMDIKNVAGAFYPPKAVLMDFDTLSTLPQRQISNGLAEAVKMAVTMDKGLFEVMENEDITAKGNIDNIIRRSVEIKKRVVEEDEHEASLRRVLNFGHTVAHGIESVNGLKNYLHGECVAMGMPLCCAPHVRERLVRVLEGLHLPTKVDMDIDAVIEASSHDKKLSGDNITEIYVNKIGEFEMVQMPFDEYKRQIREAFIK
ncbi:MAG: 3-dehydroquinate synthase [Clostridiales bacterium]|nr:3-dehydroquinate synthase [Clostridiales bacterium]